MLNRRAWLLAAIATGACTPSKKAPATALPERVGAWTRSDHSRPPSGEAPAAIARFAVAAIEKATYSGPGGETLHAEAYHVASEAAGLELEQTWRPEPNAVGFHVGTFFVIMRYDKADRSALNSFVRELQAFLMPK